MGILLGLATALSWGTSDFFARYATRSIGTLRTMLYMQSIGFVLLTFFLFHFHGWGHLFDGSGGVPWAWGLLAGVINAFATITLYRSFEIGKLSIVAPLSAAYPALTVTLSILTGEQLTKMRLAGIIATILGVMLVAGGEESADPRDIQTKSSKGMGWALASALGFGVLFWLLGTHIVPATGPFATVWLVRLTGAVITLGIVLTNRIAIEKPTGNVRWQLAGMGVLDTSAYLLNNRGMQLEQVAVVSVLSSLYGAVTITLAALVLREHVSRWQWTGIISIFSGIYLISH